MSKIIRINNACKSLKKQCVLNGVTVEFEENKISGIIGRNGSGKTVLLKAVLGLMPLDQGIITSNGKIIGKDTEFLENVGFIINEPGFLPYYSGIHNLEYIASIRKTLSRKRIEESMKKVGLNPEERKPVGQYSMGMKQRLAIAQAIMESPSILILDEPMNGLDDKGVEDIRKLLRQMQNEGCSILLSSHNKEDIDLLCDEVYRMDKGSLKQER